MSATEHTPHPPTIELEEFPRFELSCLFDSEDEPTEVTVFPASNDFDISTNWITADVSWAIPLDQVQ